MKKFEIKKPPEEPKKREIIEYIDLHNWHSGLTLIDIIRMIPLDIPLEEVHPYRSSTGHQLGFKYHTLEDESSFKKRMTRYRADLKRYNEWKEKNKKKIEQELEIQRKIREKANQYRKEIKEIKNG